MLKTKLMILIAIESVLGVLATYGEIYLSEIQFVRPNGAPPRVELINTSEESIDISGWVLGDSVERGYTFPSGTVVESEGIVVVSFGGSENDGDEVPENCTYLYCQSEYGNVAFRSQDGGKCSLFSSTADAGEQKENQLMDYMIWGSNQYLGNRPLKVSWLRLCGSPISLDEELEKNDSAYFFSEVGSIGRSVYNRAGSIGRKDWCILSPEEVSIGKRNPVPGENVVINDWVSALDDLPVQKSESGVFISEIQCLRKRGLPIRVELVNTSSAAIDISGWKMFDKVGGEYCFPSGTFIEANGFAVIAFGKEKRERSVEKKCTYLHYTNEGSEDLFKGLINECSLVSVTEENGLLKHVLVDYVCWGKSNQSRVYTIAEKGGLWPGGAVYVGTGEPVVGGTSVLLVEGSISRRVYRRSSSRVSDWEPVPAEAVSIGFQNARPSPGLMDVFPDGPVKLRWFNESLYEDEFYQLQISEKKTFRKLFLDEKLKRSEYSPSHAGTGEFYWRVRIISQGREGAWSQVGHYIVAPSEKDEIQYLALQYLAQLCGENINNYTAKSFFGLWGATVPEGGLVSLIIMEDGTCALTYDEEDFEADLGVWRFVGGYLIAEFDDGDDLYYCALYKGILQVLSEEYLPPMPFTRLQTLIDMRKEDSSDKKPFLGHWETTGKRDRDHVHIYLEENGDFTQSFREQTMSGSWAELDRQLSLDVKADEKSSSANAVYPTQDYLLVSYESPEKLTRRFIRSETTFSDRMSLDSDEKPFLGVWELKLPDSEPISIRIEENGLVAMTEDDQETAGSWTVEGDAVVISLGGKQISAWIVNPDIMVVCFEWKKYRYNQTVAFHRIRDASTFDEEK